MPGRVYRFVVNAVRKPRAELTRQEQRVRFAIDLGAHCWRTLQHHRAEGMAAELSYRTIFSLIPVCVLGLVMFRAFGGLEQVQDRLEQQLFSFFGVPDVAYTEPATAAEAPPPVADLEGAPAPPGAEPPPPGGVGPAVDEDGGPAASDEEEDAEAEELARAKQLEFRANIRRALSQMIAQVAELDFASIGLAGVVLLIYAAIALLDALEHIFNLIFESPSSRPWHLRIAIHWSIITLGSALLAIILYLSGQLVTWAGGAGIGQPGTRALNRLLAFMASWVLLFLLYALMPNTKVSMRAAALGALVSAVLWEFAKIAFQIYVSTALPYSALYGTLGLIPVFLFWVYITWLIVLFGLVWTYTLQVAPGRVPTREEDEQHAVEHDEGDFDMILPVAVIVAHAFADGQVVDRSTIARALALPPRVVRRLCHRLEEAALIRAVEHGDDEEGAVALARPAERIDVTELIALADTIPSGTPPPVRTFLEQMREARCAAARGMSLADLVEREEAAGPLAAALKANAAEVPSGRREKG